MAEKDPEFTVGTDWKEVARLVLTSRELDRIEEEPGVEPPPHRTGVVHGVPQEFLDHAKRAAILERIGNRNAKAEYYLTDAVEIAAAMGERAVRFTPGGADTHPAATVALT